MNLYFRSGPIQVSSKIKALLKLIIERKIMLPLRFIQMSYHAKCIVRVNPRIK